MKNDIKVALIQQNYKGSKKATKKFTKSLIKEASNNGANLVVLQEMHQFEYFCKSENVKYFEYAQEFEDDILYWSKIAKKYNIVLVTSLFEKRAQGLYHNTAVVFDTDGSLAGKYRKMHIPDDPGFYEKFYFTEGDLGFEPIQTSIGKLGVLICWDQWYPEAARVMALKGADILIYPTSIGWFDSDTKEEKQKQINSWVFVQRGHAIANGLPLVCVNRVGYEKDESGVLNGIRFWGNSFVCGAQGEILTMATQYKEEILYSDIELSRTKEVRENWPFFRDRRIGNYQDISKRWAD